MVFDMPSKAYDHDAPMMTGLGLKTTGFNREWTDLGTVVTREAEPDGEFGPRPETAIKVEVSAMPAQFWRFTITRPRDDAKTVDGKVIGIYEPVEVIEMTTGSGGFRDYWPVAKMIADHMLEVERKGVK